STISTESPLIRKTHRRAPEKYERGPPPGGEPRGASDKRSRLSRVAPPPRCGLHACERCAERSPVPLPCLRTPEACAVAEILQKVCWHTPYRTRRRCRVQIEPFLRLH